MNYEELLNNRAVQKPKASPLPIGVLSRCLEGGKYLQVVRLRTDLPDYGAFLQRVKRECEMMAGLADRHQLRFALNTVDGCDELVLEQSNVETLQQLLQENPSVVARSGFIDALVDGLFDRLEQMHAKGVRHLCLSPANVFVRRGDSQVMLLSYGSHYQDLGCAGLFYTGFEDFVAPEVMAGSQADSRADIYSLGKLIAFLYANGSMPFEYKRVVAKATSQDASDRYESVAAMRSALASKRGLRQTTVSLVVALAVALLCVGLYFELVPETEDIEYVKPVPKSPTEEELLDQGFNEKTELGVYADTVAPLTDEERSQLNAYQQRCEQIFRKRYEQDAEKILSKVYNPSAMRLSQAKYMENSRSVSEELVRLQQSLAEEVGISNVRSQLIAAEVIEQLTEKLKKASQAEK